MPNQREATWRASRPSLDPRLSRVSAKLLSRMPCGVPLSIARISFAWPGWAFRRGGLDIAIQGVAGERHRARLRSGDGVLGSVFAFSPPRGRKGKKPGICLVVRTRGVQHRMNNGRKLHRGERTGQLADVSDLPSGLARSQYEFCLNYVANGFNASAAYRAAHPTASKHTARVEGCRTLIKPAVQEFLATQIGDRWKGLQMDGDEVLARVSMDARADPRLLFDEKGKPFAPADWPDEISPSGASSSPARLRHDERSWRCLAC